VKEHRYKTMALACWVNQNDGLTPIETGRVYYITFHLADAFIQSDLQLPIIGTFSRVKLKAKCLTQGHTSGGVPGGMCSRWDLNSQPSDLQPTSLSIRPPLPTIPL